jgi:hypothetical protein
MVSLSDREAAIAAHHSCLSNGPEGRSHELTFDRAGLSTGTAGRRPVFRAVLARAEL